MEIIKKFEINLIYIASDWQEWRLESIINETAFLSEEHYALEEFFFAQGGIELIEKGHYIFYRDFQFHDLQSGPVSFLLYSLVNLKHLSSTLFWDYLLENESYLANLSDLSGNQLRLSAHEENKLRLDYIRNPQEKIKSRNNFFFENLIINKDEWITASIVALNEYFEIVDEICKNKNQLDSEYLYNLLKRWRQV